MVTSSTKILASLALAGAVLLSAAACASEDSAIAPTPTATPTTVAPDEEEAPAVENAGIPIDIDCGALISPQAIYDFNPNFVLLNTATVTPGSQAATAIAHSGIACTWVNESSNETITVSAANLPAEKITEIGNALLTSSNSVPTYNVEGYFQMVGDTGEAEALSGTFWVTATSTVFFEPGDAAPIMAGALAGLGR